MSTDELTDYFGFLDDLRCYGETNMFGAAPYLAAEFEELNATEARAVLATWMRTYDNAKTPAERAELVV